MGYGNGSFAVETVYPTGEFSHPTVVIVEDLNNNNRSDLTVFNTGTDRTATFIGCKVHLFSYLCMISF